MGKATVEAHRVVRSRDSHIFYTIGSQMAVWLPPLCAGSPLPRGRLLVLISARGRVDHRTILRGRIRSIEKKKKEKENPTYMNCDMPR
jgi:hypothetical protein